ncbi:hypothetical protein [Roseibium sp.]|uniref:hypothetical protein n=1 Tax=Roseibium sp. TaxID=1936156 RepID=UPI003265E1A1
MLIGHGTFTPGQGHELEGTFTLTQRPDGVLMKASMDFFFDGSPGPGWALSMGVPSDRDDPLTRQFAAETDFLRLARNQPIRGPHSGLIRPSIDIDAFDTLFLWCYSIPFILGVGKITRTDR